MQVAIAEPTVAGGFVASLWLGTPRYLGLASASWFAFGPALPLPAVPPRAHPTAGSRR